MDLDETFVCPFTSSMEYLNPLGAFDLTTKFNNLINVNAFLFNTPGALRKLNALKLVYPKCWVISGILEMRLTDVE